MNFQCAAAFLRSRTVFFRLCLGRHRLRDPQTDQFAHLLRRRMPQDQHRHGDAVATQFPRLIQTGYGQVICSGILQRPGHLYGAMAIGIRLDYSQKLHTHADTAAQSMIIIQQMVEINLCPGSSQIGLHKRVMPPNPVDLHVNKHALCLQKSIAHSPLRYKYFLPAKKKRDAQCVPPIFLY